MPQLPRLSAPRRGIIEPALPRLTGQSALAGGLAALADVFDKIQENQDTVAAGRLQTQMMSRLGELDVEMEQHADPDTYVETFNKEFDKIQSDILDKAPNERVRFVVEQNIERQRAAKTFEAQVSAGRIGINRLLADNAETLDVIQREALIEKDPVQRKRMIDEGVGIIRAGIAGGLYSPMDGMQKERLFMSNIDYQDAVLEIDTDPEPFLEEFTATSTEGMDIAKLTVKSPREISEAIASRYPQLTTEQILTLRQYARNVYDERLRAEEKERKLRQELIKQNLTRKALIDRTLTIEEVDKWRSFLSEDDYAGYLKIIRDWRAAGGVGDPTAAGRMRLRIQRDPDAVSDAEILRADLNADEKNDLMAEKQKWIGYRQDRKHVINSEEYRFYNEALEKLTGSTPFGITALRPMALQKAEMVMRRFRELVAPPDGSRGIPEREAYFKVVAQYEIIDPDQMGRDLKYRSGEEIVKALRAGEITAGEAAAAKAMLLDYLDILKTWNSARKITAPRQRGAAAGVEVRE